MELWEILIPTVSNTGRPFRVRHHRIWDAKVREITGGLTIMAATVRGDWVAPDGEIYSERMIPVRVACDEAAMIQIADLAAHHYGQLAMFFYRVSDRVVCKHYAAAPRKNAA